MAGPVGAVTGVVGAVGGIAQQASAKRIQAAQQANQEKAARVQGQLDELAFRQQQDYSRMQMDVQDRQASYAEEQQRLETRAATQREIAQINIAMEQVQSQAIDQERQLLGARFQVGEQQRQLESQALNQQEQVGNQTNQVASQVADALRQGKTQLALNIAAGAARGMMGSKANEVAVAKEAERLLEQGLDASQMLNAQGQTAEMEQDYMRSIGGLQAEGQLNELNFQETAGRMTNVSNQATLLSERELARQGGKMAQNALKGSSKIRQQVSRTNRAFNEAGASVQRMGMQVQNASQMAQIQAQGALARNQAGGFLSALPALGGVVSQGLGMFGNRSQAQAPTQSMSAAQTFNSGTNFSLGAPNTFSTFNGQPSVPSGGFTGQSIQF